MDFVYPYGATPINPNEASGLLLSHISTQQELNRWEQDNINEAFMWLAGQKNINTIDTNFIYRVHKEMFNNVWRWAGKARVSEKKLGVEVFKISQELKVLCDDFDYWKINKTYSYDEIAYRFHHRLVFIHSFSNGNGRHARLMADIILKKIFNKDFFTWGSGDLIKTGECRKKYIDALRAADKGDYSLLAMFVRS